MSLFGAPSQAKQQTVASGVTIQSSCYGGVVPVVYGETRMVGNLVDYDDFQAIQQKTSGSGKGGGGGGKSGGTTTDYKASFIFALCEGPIGGINTYYSSKAQSLFSSSGLSLATGGLTQSPWGTWATKHPAKALAYAGTAYIYVAAYDLGNAAQLPNFSFEVTGLFPNAISGLPDADPKDVVTDVLTNPRYGVGFPTARLGDLSIFSHYCRATGMVVSPLFSTQQDAASQLNQIVQDCNSEFVWSGTTLTIVPYGDQSVSANGASYTAPSAPLYSLTDNDFIETGSGDPVQCSRKRPSDAWNSVKLEWLNRANQYNTEIVESRDQASIEAYGLRGDQPSQSHHFCNLTAATMAATLRLQRQAIRNQYTFTLGWRYCLLDPMDIVEISDPGLGLVNQWVRILSMEEDDRGDIKVTAEDYLAGTGAAPLYSYASGSPFVANYNTAPGSINTPFFYEPPPPLLAQGVDQNPQVWVGASGGANWGGCNVWLSVDGTTYRLMGTIDSPCRQGFLTAPLPLGSDPDTADTLSVDLTESFGTLISATAADADAGRTVCCVDGELISYSTATLTAANKYNLTGYLRRGAFGSLRASHGSGAPFCRLDDAILTIDLPTGPVSYVGVMLHLKFTSFNLWGGGEESLASVPAYTYTPSGAGAAVAQPTGIAVTMAYIRQGDGTIVSTMDAGWTASPDPLFNEYELQYQPHGGGWTNPASLLIGAGTVTALIMPVTAGQAYDVRIRAIRAASAAGGPFYSPWNETDNHTAVGKGSGPNAASGLTATAGVLGIQLNWTASPDSDIAGYRITRNTTATFPFTVMQEVSATAYLDQSGTVGTAYYYWITAYDTSGNQSASIGPVSATASLVGTSNLAPNAATSQVLSFGWNTDAWLGYTFVGADYGVNTPIANLSGVPVTVRASVTVGNAYNPGSNATGLTTINGYPFEPPAQIVLDVYRIPFGGAPFHVAGVVLNLSAGGTYTYGYVQVVNGVVDFEFTDTPPGPGLYQYGFDYTPYGTFTPGVAPPFAIPFSNFNMRILELKR